jgi:opacity protein-like surface antigen
MTKITLLMLLIVAPLFSLFAQQNRFEVGPLAGLNCTSLRGNGFSKYFDYHVSYTSGLSFQYNITKALSLHANIAYESKGCSGKDMKVVDAEGVSKGKHFFDFSYQYLTVPVMFRYSIGDHNKFFVNAGPYMGYLLNYTEKLNDVEITRTTDMRKLDFGFSTGIGVATPLADGWNLTIELRNNLGFADLRKCADCYETSPMRPAYELPTVKTNSTSFILGIQYLIK